MNQTDEQLMMAYGKGEEQAFAELYLRHKSSLFRYFLRQLPKNNARAEELFQDTWFRVIDKRKSYTPTAKFTTWLYQIGHNLLVDEYRRDTVRNDHLNLLRRNESETPDESEQRKATALKHCVEALPDAQREAFLLKHEAGFEMSQISEIVEVQKETVKTRLRYALNQLRQCLTRKLGERT